jgi:hypothetical protein
MFMIRTANYRNVWLYWTGAKFRSDTRRALKFETRAEAEGTRTAILLDLPADFTQNIEIFEE